MIISDKPEAWRFQEVPDCSVFSVRFSQRRFFEHALVNPAFDLDALALRLSVDQRPGTRQHVRLALSSRATVSLFRAWQVPLLKNTNGISHESVLQFVVVWV